MCNKEWFFDFDEQFRKTMKLGDNSRKMAMGKGNIKLHINRITHVFTEVYFIPELKNNLFIIGQLEKKNLAVIIKNNICKVCYHKGGLIMQ